MPLQEPQYLLGFEIEGLISTDRNRITNRHALDDLRDYLADLYNGYADIGDDGSIDSDAGEDWAMYFDGIEIRTPALPIGEALEKLEWLLGMLAIMSEERMFDTNETCGFHVNVSERNIFMAEEAIGRELFGFFFLQKFNTQKWLETFDRVDNEFAEYYEAPKSLRDMLGDDGYVFYEHHTAINLEKLDEDESAEERRIEIRCAGNADYHTHPRLSEYISEIIETLNYATSRACLV